MKLVLHSVVPVVVIVAVSVLCALGRLTDTETLTVISAAAGFGAVTLASKDKPGQ